MVSPAFVAAESVHGGVFTNRCLCELSLVGRHGMPEGRAFRVMNATTGGQPAGTPWPCALTPSQPYSGRMSASTDGPDKPGAVSDEPQQPKIPPHTPGGHLPPFVGDPTALTGRSPYLVGLVDVVNRFGTSPERCRIVSGFLRMRRALHDLGNVRDGSGWTGVLWSLDDREPGDIDVVSFLYPPQNGPADRQDAASLLAALHPAEAKKRFSCHAFYIQFEGGPEHVVKLAVYYSQPVLPST